MAHEDDLARLAGALKALMVAYAKARQAERRRREAKGDGPKFRSFTAADLMSRQWPGKTEEQADELIDRPVSAAIRHAVRVVGERAYQIGGTSLMEAVLETALKHSKTYSYKAGAIDHIWDGIGLTKGSKDFWAC